MSMSTSSPLYVPALHQSRDAKLAAMADAIDRKRTRDPNRPNAKWVKELSSNANKDRFVQWVSASPEERSALEEQWQAEDAAADEAKRKAEQDEQDRRKRVIEARVALQGR
jgi:hypothetical protein